MMRKTKTSERDPLARGGLWRHKGGNIALITALVMIPLTFALGMAFDFTLSQSRKDQLQGVADAAALGGVTPAEMALSPASAQAQSTSLFNGQEISVAGVTGLNLTVTANDVASGTVVTRTVVVSYTGQSKNTFASLLGMPTLPISGSSTATSTTAPNINFYLLLDTSPSMELGATTAAIATLQSYTQNQVDGSPGCAFGCHQSNPGDLPAFTAAGGGQITCTAAGSYADGTTFSVGSKFPTSGRDNYDLTRCVGVKLRIDLLRDAVQNLVSTASTTQQTDNATYKMALYETDTNQANSANDFNVFPLQTMTPVPTNPGQVTSSALYTQAGTITALEMYNNNDLVSQGDGNGDMDTYLDADVQSMNTNYLVTPGGGTKTQGDSPQEVLFIVTDGLNDATPTRTYAPLDWNGTICTAIKNRGIRIAVLYTEYFPLTAPNGWYEKAVAPALPTGLPPGLPPSTPVGTDPMALGAQQCASPGLFYEVSTDGDISAALQTLFQEAVATARLSH
jgi:Flp pilus assembly protein TadG